MTSQGLATGRPLRVACVGGGQLGRMMALEAPRLGIKMRFLDPSGTDCPAAQVVPHERILQGSLKDPAAIHALVQECDVVTVEIEHVGVETLEQLEKEGVNVQPSARVLGIIRDKYLQKVRRLHATEICVFDACMLLIPHMRAMSLFSNTLLVEAFHFRRFKRHRPCQRFRRQLTV